VPRAATGEASPLAGGGSLVVGGGRGGGGGGAVAVAAALAMVAAVAGAVVVAAALAMVVVCCSGCSPACCPGSFVPTTSSRSSVSSVVASGTGAAVPVDAKTHTAVAATAALSRNMTGSGREGGSSEVCRRRREGTRMRCDAAGSDELARPCEQSIWMQGVACVVCCDV